MADLGTFGRARGLLLIGALGLACSVQARDYPTSADTGQTRAFITIQRSLSLEDGRAQADALVAFVRIPVSVDPEVAVRLVGFGVDLPPAGHCATEGQSRQSAPALNPMARVEFLDAGDVTVVADGHRLKLAPHAFPTVTDLISGVVYTTRDRQAAPLPAFTPYSIEASGGWEVDAIRLEGAAPEMLEQAWAEGSEVSGVVAVSTGGPLDLTWAPGKAGDVVYARLSGNGAASVVCSYGDETGTGAVPTTAFDGAVDGRLELHRLRAVEPAAFGVDRSELRFDYQLSARVAFTD